MSRFRLTVTAARLGGEKSDLLLAVGLRRLSGGEELRPVVGRRGVLGEDNL